MLRLAAKILGGTALAYGLIVVAVFLAELLRAILDEVDWDQGD